MQVLKAYLQTISDNRKTVGMLWDQLPEAFESREMVKSIDSTPVLHIDLNFLP